MTYHNYKDQNVYTSLLLRDKQTRYVGDAKYKINMGHAGIIVYKSNHFTRKNIAERKEIESDYENENEEDDIEMECENQNENKYDDFQQNETTIARFSPKHIRVLSVLGSNGRNKAGLMLMIR